MSPTYLDLKSRKQNLSTQKISEYDQEITHSYTGDQPMAL